MPNPVTPLAFQLYSMLTLVTPLALQKFRIPLNLGDENQGQQQVEENKH
jgi:hypothetical protein